MAKYQTAQRKRLISYLSTCPDQLLSARQIASALRDANISISAVYRNLSGLESENKVRRYSKSGSKEVLYQYIAAESCAGCLHLSCTNCGKTFHMDQSDTDVLIRQIAKNKSFSLDKSNTVLYGICKECKAK